MKCQVASSTTHNVLISKKISYKSYKEICRKEAKKVRLGFNNAWDLLVIENNTLIPYPPRSGFLYGQKSQWSYDWEVLSKFFSIHNIEPSWLDCDFTWGWYDEELGGWTGCMGKV